MRKRKYSLFDHWWQTTDPWSVGRWLLLLIIGPVLFTKLVVNGTLFALVVFEAVKFPSALRTVIRAFKEAEALGQTDRNSTQLKGGEYRSSYSKGFLIRPGGSLSSDDLRRRLNELRTPHKRRKRRTPKIGGQNGK